MMLTKKEQRDIIEKFDLNNAYLYISTPLEDDILIEDENQPDPVRVKIIKME